MAEQSHTLATYPPGGPLPSSPRPCAAYISLLGKTEQKVREFQLAVDRLMKKLARRGINQNAIARLTGIRKSQLRSYRNGTSLPNRASFDKLRRFARLGPLPDEHLVVRACRDQGWDIPEPPAPSEGEAP